MAKRLTSRLSAGAALVTGIGMMGIATAAPAQAATTMQYSCTTPLGPQVFDVALDTDAPAESAVGEELSITPSGSVTLNPDTANAMAGALGWEEVGGDIPGVVATISNGTDSIDVPTDLTIPRTQIFDADGGGWTLPGGASPELTVNGTTQTASITETGEYTVSAPDTFTATFSGYTATGDAGPLSPITSECTYVAGSGSQVIDTIMITEAAPEPEVDDWFDEPGTLPLVDNVFTVSGEATRAGTLSIQVLAGSQDDAGESVPGDVLTTYTMEATEGANEQDFNLVEGADYVRIVSQECVDAQGNDETVVNSGCNVTYRAPWADTGDDEPTDPGTDEPTDPGTDPADDGDDAGTPTPEIPAVVQTDGLTPAMTSQEDSTGTLALGGLLLAGAGVGTVLVMRRRAQQH